MYMSPAGRITQLCFINHHKFTQVIKLLIGAYILRNGVSLALGFLDGSVVKNLPANAGDSGSVPGLGGSPGEGIGNPLQHSCLGNPVDRGTWRATACAIFNLSIPFCQITAEFLNMILHLNFICFFVL